MSIDANAWLGEHDIAIKELKKAMPVMNQCGSGSTTPYGLRLDFVFSTLAADRIEGCRTLPDEFGSDHRPIVVTLSH